MDKEIHIDKNIPIPSTYVHRDSKYPFHKLGIGDSFSAKDVTTSSMYSAIKVFRSHHPEFHFTVRSWEQGEPGSSDHETGVRVWRVEPKTPSSKKE